MKNNYKVLLCLLAAVLLSNYSLLSQKRYSKQSKVELSVQGTYLFGGILPTTTGELNFVNNFGVVGELTYMINRGVGVNLSYTYVPTELRYTDYRNFNTESKLFDLDMHYFFLNYVYENETRGPATPYALIGLGGMVADPKDEGYESEVRFATNIGGGIRFNLSSKVGFKIQARMLLPIYYATSTVYTSPTSGGYGVSSGAVVQADLSAGLSIKF